MRRVLAALLFLAACGNRERDAHVRLDVAGFVRAAQLTTDTPLVFTLTVSAKDLEAPLVLTLDATALSFTLDLAPGAARRFTILAASSVGDPYFWGEELRDLAAGKTVDLEITAFKAGGARGNVKTAGNAPLPAGFIVPFLPRGVPDFVSPREHPFEAPVAADGSFAIVLPTNDYTVPIKAIIDGVDFVPVGGIPSGAAEQGVWAEVGTLLLAPADYCSASEGITPDLDQDGTPCDVDCNDADPDANLGDLDGDGVTSCSGDCDDTKAGCSADCTDDDADLLCVDHDCDDNAATGAACSAGCDKLFRDDDGDGHGKPGAFEVRCPGSPGFSTSSDDCRDDSPNCVLDCSDADGDGFCGASDCSPNASSCTTDCTTDSDSDGMPDCVDVCHDPDGDHFGDDSRGRIVGAGTITVGNCHVSGSEPCILDQVSCSKPDCNEGNPHCGDICADADADGFCPGFDCDDTTETGTSCTSGCGSYWKDADADGYGDPLTMRQACGQPSGYLPADSNVDCNDTRPTCTDDCTDADGDGICGVLDCDDTPGVGMACGLTGCMIYAGDADSDGFRDVDFTTTSCAAAPPPGLVDVTAPDDVDDNNPNCGSIPMDADNDGYCVDQDCDDNASSCTSVCGADADGDSRNDCIDLCDDIDSDGYGTTRVATIIGGGSLSVDQCTDGAGQPCDIGGACIDVDCNPNSFYCNVGVGCGDGDGDGKCGSYDCDDARPTCASDCTDSDLDTACNDQDNAPNNPYCDTNPSDVDGDGHCANHDCNDNDSTVWAACGACEDKDGDGAFVNCDTYAPPGPDCDDSLATGVQHSPADPDGDGVSTCNSPVDCRPNDPFVSPRAAERCDNIVDDDCDGDIDAADGDCGCLDYDGDGYRCNDCNDIPCQDDDNDGVCNTRDCQPNDAISGGLENCNDSNDNDCDGLADLADPDCQSCSDSDSDGFCDPVDCDVLDGTKGDVERCNDSIDNDCDGFTDATDSDCNTGAQFLPVDADNDGVSLCNKPLDCSDNPGVDPTAAQRGPGRVELCNDGIDNDCDGDVDSADSACACTDADNDGLCQNIDCDDSSAAVGLAEDNDHDGYASVACPLFGLDCNDFNPRVHPGAAEQCDNGYDDNCNSMVDTADTFCRGCPDNDGDGYRCTDCDDNDPAKNPIDQDNDGYSTCSAPADCDDNDSRKSPFDGDFDGFSTCSLPVPDCDDTDASSYPNGGPEPLCDGRDNNCNGVMDDVLGGASNNHDGDPMPDCQDNCPFATNPTQVDTDNDRVGDACEGSPACIIDAARSPRQPERCLNGIDDDCNGTTDDGGVCPAGCSLGNDADGDGFFVAGGPCLPVGGLEDCDDGESERNPGFKSETGAQCADGIDNDCDGTPDAGDSDCRGRECAGPTQLGALAAGTHDDRLFVYYNACELAPNTLGPVGACSSAGPDAFVSMNLVDVLGIPSELFVCNFGDTTVELVSMLACSPDSCLAVLEPNDCFVDPFPGSGPKTFGLRMVDAVGCPGPDAIQMMFSMQRGGETSLFGH